MSMRGMHRFPFDAIAGDWYVAVILVCLLLVPGAGADDIRHGKVLIAVYASGGTLETDYGLITDDLMQMVSGSEGISPETLEVLVAYGGSAKPGWEGMKIADIRGISDVLAEGGMAGNTSHALAVYPDASMGDAASLGTFLTFIRDRYVYDRIFLILIGHGEAYTGMLFDQNHGNDPLTIPELVTGMQTGGFNVEVIGLDTCLMSTLEVVSALRGYVAFLIASEESEPAEGWQYDTLIRYLGENPDAPVSDAGAVLLEAYLENPVQGKTLSVLDLSVAGEVTAELDQVSRLLIPFLETPEGFMAVKSIIEETQQFGLTGEGILDPATMDLIGFAEKIGSLESGLFAEPAADLVQALRNMVLLSGHDNLVPDAQGIAILSPVQISSSFYQYYHDEASITPSWDRFMTRYLAWADKTGNRTLNV